MAGSRSNMQKTKTDINQKSDNQLSYSRKLLSQPYTNYQAKKVVDINQ